MMDRALRPLLQALDARAEAGLPPLSLWWRDDDLECPSRQLSEFLAAMAEVGIEPALAAISGAVTAEAILALDGSPARVLPHGWRHDNHEPEGAKKSEYGPARPVDERLAEIDAACGRIDDQAGDRALALFTPPWNNIPADLTPHLGRSRALALSGYRALGRPAPPAAIPRLDTHLDLIDWRGNRRGLPVARVAELLAAWIEPLPDHENTVDSPVGVLSHHLVTSPDDWRAWAPVWRLLAGHTACRWVSPEVGLCIVRKDWNS